MKRFLLRLFFFLIPTIGTIIGLFRYQDPFYARFTTPKQSAMILGTSRAAQGILPQVLDSTFNIPYPFFNYAFTVAHSPFGPAYLESTKAKLDTQTTNSVFIVSITPWALSAVSEAVNDTSRFVEQELCVAQTSQVNQFPNFEYLLENYHQPQQAFTLPWVEQSPTYLHSNGWLEVTVDMNEKVVAGRIRGKLLNYSNGMLQTHSFSELRLAYLLQTITLLQKYGKVYLVRMPVHPKMMELEQQFMPDFQAKIQLAIEQSNGYLDLTPYNEEFRYTDGNHLYKESAYEVSRIIGVRLSLTPSGTGSAAGCPTDFSSAIAYPVEESY